EEVLACCSFHTPYCVHESHEEVVKIKVPNTLALCAECYMISKGRAPPPLSILIAPGVVPTSMAKSKLKEKKKEVVPTAKQLKQPLLCAWVPNPDNANHRGFECSNGKFLDAHSMIPLNTCAWHTTQCVRVHPLGSASAVTVPNKHGLCAMHHLSEHGLPPPLHPFPLPGMVVRIAKDNWKSKQHFATPLSPPPGMN
ncbi:hypothetical protein B484DRAFT_20511, partial [Ochromonadaceae sp. CCMP2298]